MRKAIMLLLLVFVQVPVLPAADSEEQRIQEILAPVLDQRVLAVGRIDLEKLDLEGFLALPDVVNGSLGRSIQRLKPLALERQRQLIEAGGTEIFVVYSLTSGNGMPVTLVVPRHERSKGDDLQKLLLKQFRQGAAVGVAEYGRVLIVGSLELSKQITEKRFRATSRPEFAAGLAAGGAKSVRVVVSPAKEQRRVLTELLPTLPGELGKLPISRLVNGVSWFSLAADVSREPTGELTIEAIDEATAKLAGEVFAEGVKFASSLESLPSSVKTTLQSGKLVSQINGKKMSVVMNAENQGVRNVTSLLTDLADQWWRDTYRTRSFNNLKQICLAMHILHDANGRFPASAAPNQPGQPAVSWRVLALPYLDREDLYKKYKFEEPWDSEHNKQLLNQMPDVFMTLDQDPESGLTTYQMPSNKNTLGGFPKGVEIREITDGTSNTVMVLQVDPGKAVPWTKPEDFEIDPAKIEAGLISEGEEKFYTGFCDGSARSISKEQLNRNKMSLFTVNGGEILDLN